ncbi:TPA: hypothetical protein HA244_04350 [Candidatus Micrarchaeota archaeon]|nr:hypothetical protein [Candidatus Micrarchaeota archaeon]
MTYYVALEKPFQDKDRAGTTLVRTQVILTENPRHPGILKGISTAGLNKAINKLTPYELREIKKSGLGHIALLLGIAQVAHREGGQKSVEISTLYPIGTHPDGKRPHPVLSGLGIAHHTLIATLKHLKKENLVDSHQVIFRGDSDYSPEFFGKRGLRPLTYYPFGEFLEKLENYKSKQAK